MGRPVALPLWALIVGVIVVGAAATMGVRFATRPKTVPERIMPAPAGAALPNPGTTNAAAPEPSPWTYDPRTNKHWDPGHHHWHDGPAPTGAARDSASRPASFTVGPTPAPIATPEPSPWAYDASRKQYWDPSHHHWHNGPSPTLAQRESLLAMRRGTTNPAPAAASGATAPADTTPR